METIFRKSLALFAALLVMVGGFLVFTSERVEAATSEQVEAARQRTIYVCQKGGYVANLCIKNRSKSNREKCTGKIPLGTVRDLTFRADRDDHLVFVVAVEGGHSAFYDPIANRDRVCWSEGGTLNATAYCRTREESDC